MPDEKIVKNRVHLDLQPADGRDVEVERLEKLGATLVADHRKPDGSGWVVAGRSGGQRALHRAIGRPSGARPRRRTPASGTSRRSGPRTSSSCSTGMLDWYRDGVIAKVDGISPAVAAAQPLGSATSIAGLVKHLALVEDSWLEDRFAGNPEPEPWRSAPWDDDRDWEFTDGPERAVRGLAGALPGGDRAVPGDRGRARARRPRGQRR